MLGKIYYNQIEINTVKNIIHRTTAPCGMPKGESKISLQAGTSINVSWHLGYPHRGMIAQTQL